MSIQVTEEAADVLRRSIELGNVDASTGGIRLRGSRALGGGFEVQVELADEPVSGDDVFETMGLRFFVEPSVAETMPDAILVLDPQHDTVTLRPKQAD